MTSEEVRKKLGYFGTSGNAQFTDHSFLYEAVRSMVEQKQKEAYNEAIDHALNIMYNHEEEIYIGVFEDIEKLKK